jgi:hypothetical protein
MSADLRLRTFQNRLLVRQRLLAVPNANRRKSASVAHATEAFYIALSNRLLRWLGRTADVRRRPCRDLAPVVHWDDIPATGQKAQSSEV